MQNRSLPLIHTIYFQAEISNLANELTVVNQENKRLKEELEKRPMTNSSASSNIEALSDLTKKLQEISSTYDDVRRDMNLLQEVSILVTFLVFFI